jgi:hypothetical protein
VLGFAAGQIGETDCEDLDDGLLAQPVNTLTSGAYALAGVWLMVRAWRGPRHTRWLQVAYAVTLMVVGIGSIAFHGPQPSWAKLVHDAPIATTLVFILLYDIQLLAGWKPLVTLTTYGMFAGAVFAGFELDAMVGIAAAGFVVVGAVVAEVLVIRRGLRVRPPWMATWRWYALMAGVLAVAGLANVLGRSEAPLCDPDSVLQLHGLWHIMTAVVLALWAVIAFPATSPDEDSDEG